MRVVGVEVHRVPGGVDEGQQVTGARQPGQEHQAAGDQIGLQAEVADEVDADRPLVVLLRFAARRSNTGSTRTPCSSRLTSPAFMPRRTR